MVLFAVIAALVALRPLSGLTQGVGDTGLFLLLNLVTVTLIVLLFFLIARNVWKLLWERRQGILGAHLNVKFVSAFVGIAILTSVGLFVISSAFITSSIDTWFSLQVERALDEAGEVAGIYYESSESNALFYARNMARHVTEARLLREDRLEELAEYVQEKQREYNLGVVEVFSSTGEELVSAINPEVPAAHFTRADSDFVRAALRGSTATRVEAAGSGDVIRGAVPIASSARPEQTVGVIVVNYFVPYSLTRKVAQIRSALLEYRNLQPAAGHIRFAYQLELFLAFLVVLLLATWLGFRLAKGVTGPIRALAEGIAEVARGNLDVEVEPQTDDEIGFLVESFNRMTRDLRETRSRLTRSHEELERRRLYMEIVLRNVGAAVISLDAEGRIATVNPPAQRLLGIPPGEGVVGQKLEEAVARPAFLEVLGELVRELRIGVRESLRRQVQVPQGEDVLTLLVTVTLLKDEERRPLGTVIVLDDYTQLVRAQRMAAWREVARRIAHEIKNPLTPIQLSAQRLRRRFRDRLASDEEGLRVFDECVDAIVTQVETLKVLVSEFSNFARLPAARPRPEDVNGLLEEAAAGYAGTEGVEIATHLDPRLPPVEVDRDQMRRVLVNLLENAAAAVAERRRSEPESGPGHIELRTVFDAVQGSARIEVVDDGCGIPASYRRRIFEPYFSTKREGTGLGLAIVSRIVANHQGHIRVVDNRPRGTRLVIELPVRRAEAR